jgi:hypothetical protein
MKYLKQVNWNLLAVVILLMVLFMPVIPVSAASNITNAEYYGVISVSNNGTSNTTVSSNITNLYGTNLIASGYCNAGANDTVIRSSSGVDVAWMPGYSSNASMVFTGDMEANSYESFILYSGNVTGGKIRYFPAAAGMTTPFNASLNLGSNWTIEIKGYFNNAVGLPTNRWVFRDVTANDIMLNNLGQVVATSWIGFGLTSALSTGEHTIRVSEDGVNAYLDIDGVNVDTDPCVAVPATGNDRYSCYNGTMSYVEYQKIWVGGNLRQHITWDYGTTFTDKSGTGNNATPTFAVDSSDADVSGNMTLFLPVAEARAPAYSLSDAPDFLTTTPAMNGTFSTAVAPTFPGAAVITAIAATSGTPVQLPFLLIATFIILACSITLSWAMRRFGPGSNFIKLVAVAVMMGIMVGLKVFDVWMVLFFVIIAVAISMGSKQQSWG